LIARPRAIGEEKCLSGACQQAGPFVSADARDAMVAEATSRMRLHCNYRRRFGLQNYSAWSIGTKDAPGKGLKEPVNSPQACDP